MVFIWSCQDSTISENIIDYGIVINEINYNSSDDFDAGDWIEIYNNTSDSINMGLWVLKDENDDNILVLPESTVIIPDHYIVFCKDSTKFSQSFPDVNFFKSELGFGLSGGNDDVRLFDSNGSLADIVQYSDDPPWTTSADGEGPTLELKHPDLDNAHWENWVPSVGFGTPGSINSSFIDNY